MTVTLQLRRRLASCSGELHRLDASSVVDASTVVVHYIISGLTMQHRPLAANTAKWYDVMIKQGQITIKGGFNAKGELADSLQYKCADGVTHTFVALHKEAIWFVKGVGGGKKGELKAVTVLTMIRQTASVADFASINEDGSPAVAGSDSQSSTDAVDYDPMDEMVALDSVAESVTNVTRTSKKRKVARACVQELQVPTRPPCVGAESSEKTIIFVYTPPVRKNSVLHLRVDCIPWLLAYAADELACQGVSCADAGSVGKPQTANCDVDNLHVEWNFSDKRWEATFVGGHAKGECLHFGASEVTPALVKKLRTLQVVHGWYNKSTSHTNKSAAKEYILIWGKAVNEMRTAEHNEMFEALLVRAPPKSDNADTASSAGEDGAEDGDALEAGDDALEADDDALVEGGSGDEEAVDGIVTDA